MQFDEEIREFLIESNENLVLLDQNIVQLEERPADLELVSSAFRVIHTIKGTCGFFGYARLGAVTHRMENLLGQVREGRRVLTPGVITLVLEGVDEVKALLRSIEETGKEDDGLGGDINERLEQECRRGEKADEDTGMRAASSLALGGGKQDRVEQDRVEPAAGDSPGSEPATVQNQPGPTPAALPVAVEPVPATGLLVRDAAAGQPREEPRPLAAADPPVVGIAAPGAQPKSEASPQTDSTIRVDVGLLNRLINLVGELVLARNQLLQEASLQSPVLQQTCQRLNLITSELQEGVMKTRMQPIGVVWNKLPRVVRDLAAQCGKQIRIEMEGANTELDKTIIEAIKDPLTHIVRNSCDHGIEPVSTRAAKGKPATGTLMLRAYHEGGVVNIEIADDGAGICPDRIRRKAVEKGLIRPEQAAHLSDREAMHLIFMPGFSTAAQVTDISGRGVGMDVVRTNIEKIGGSVDVQNRPEGGTSVRIKIPLTLAIIPGLVVTQNGGAQDANSSRVWSRQERFVIPQANLLELVRIEAADMHGRISLVHGTPVLHHRGELLPLIYLDHVLRKPGPRKDTDSVNIVVLQAENRRLGVVVDTICDTQEIVVKPLGRHLKALTCYVGATIMGDGRPALILDVGGLARLAGLSLQGRQSMADAPQKAADSGSAQAMLLFRVGIYQRVAVPLAFVDRLEEVACSRIESAAGQQALHYRDGILPLLSFPQPQAQQLQVPQPQLLQPQALQPEAAIGPAPGHAQGAREPKAQDSVQVIVFADGPRRLGLIVDQILDIVTDPVTQPRPSSSPWILGSGVLDHAIVDLLDLQAVVEASRDGFATPAQVTDGSPNLLMLLDNPGLGRDLVREYLSIAGYRVYPVATCDEARACVQAGGPGVCLAAEELLDSRAGTEASALLELLAAAGVGFITMTERRAPRIALPGAGLVVCRSDRAALLEAIVSAGARATPQGGAYAHAPVA